MKAAATVTIPPEAKVKQTRISNYDERDSDQRLSELNNASNIVRNIEKRTMLD